MSLSNDARLPWHGQVLRTGMTCHSCPRGRKGDKRRSHLSGLHTLHPSPDKSRNKGLQALAATGLVLCDLVLCPALQRRQQPRPIRLRPVRPLRLRHQRPRRPGFTAEEKYVRQRDVWLSILDAKGKQRREDFRHSGDLSPSGTLRRRPLHEASVSACCG